MSDEIRDLQEALEPFAGIFARWRSFLASHNDVTFEQWFNETISMAELRDLCEVAYQSLPYSPIVEDES
jgi:hypothetical protein